MYFGCKIKVKRFTR